MKQTNVMRMWCYETFTMGKPVAGSLSLMFKFSWETVFFESEGGFKMPDRNKLFASNEKKIDNHTLMLDILHSYMLLCVNLPL